MSDQTAKLVVELAYYFSKSSRPTIYPVVFHIYRLITAPLYISYRLTSVPLLQFPLVFHKTQCCRYAMLTIFFQQQLKIRVVLSSFNTVIKKYWCVVIICIFSAKQLQPIELDLFILHHLSIKQQNSAHN